MAIKYRGRWIRADPCDKRKRWYVYLVSAKRIPVLYIGISTDPTKRFNTHKKRFKFKREREWFDFDKPRKLKLRVLDGPLDRVQARRMEIDLHLEHPNAKSRKTVLEHLKRRP
ncbi:MAG: GIY-YIG nuclease family protein [Chloroflexi bacterium]|nr:GIY-YIG nuclease family protein [Chloroflexota bacterium]